MIVNSYQVRIGVKFWTLCHETYRLLPDVKSLFDTIDLICLGRRPCSFLPGETSHSLTRMDQCPIWPKTLGIVIFWYGCNINNFPTNPLRLSFHLLTNVSGAVSSLHQLLLFHFSMLNGWAFMMMMETPQD